MFYAALAAVQSLAHVPRVPSKHAGVIGLFDTEFVLSGRLPKELSKDIHRTFELRQRADYKAAPALPPAYAENACLKAAQFVKAVADYLQTHEPGIQG